MDIFDRIMELGVFKPIQPFYKKYKEILLYLFFGGLTFIVSMTSYVGAEVLLNLDPLFANIISWILSVLFAYITNRTWVFSAKAIGGKAIMREMGSFCMGRVATLILEEIILLIGIRILHLDSILVKAVAQVIVVLSNYYISKLIVFKEKK